MRSRGIRRRPAHSGHAVVSAVPLMTGLGPSRPAEFDADRLGAQRESPAGPGCCKFCPDRCMQGLADAIVWERQMRAYRIICHQGLNIRYPSAATLLTFSS
jgi:hypothetical protein